MGAMDARRLDDTIDRVEARIDRLVSELKEYISGVEARIELKIDARSAQQEATLTRRMVAIMGSWTILVGSTVGWLTVLFR